MARHATPLDVTDQPLDPRTEYEEIGRRTAAIDFPWDTRRAYELALLKTFAVPSSSRLLASTGEFTKRTAKRHDDTVAIVASLGLYGLNSEQGRRALRIMNKAHAVYNIDDAEHRYTLARFVLEPIAWNQRFGWRPLTQNEKQAGFHFWMEVGRRMAVTELPETLSELEHEAEVFEQKHVSYDPANRRLLDAVLASRTQGLGIAGQAMARAMVAAQLDDRYRQAFALKRPPPWFRHSLRTTLSVKAAAVRQIPRRKRPAPMPTLRTYPNGLDWSEVGPAHARNGSSQTP